MKKIIEGALYNTETAKKLGFWKTRGLSGSDFNYCSETFFRTKSGKYFLYGKGGAMSKYSENVGRSSIGSEQILPISPLDAREWAEEKLTADEFIELFGEVEEASDGREALTLTVPAGVKAKLQTMKENSGKSMSQMVTDWVESL